MTREELAHILRAAGGHLGFDTFIVVGSAALLGSYPETLVNADVLYRSIEADLVPPDFDDATADKIDGAFGELSQFQATHGVYADGVSLTTANPPPGWHERLVPFSPRSANGVVGWCLEPHDLVAAKLAAGRFKDVEFTEAMVRSHLVNPAVLKSRSHYNQRVVSHLKRIIGTQPSSTTGQFKPTIDISGLDQPPTKPPIPLDQNQVVSPDLDFGL